jgi:hypothetical protein
MDGKLCLVWMNGSNEFFLDRTILKFNIMADSKEKLFPDFPSVSTEQGMEKVIADLKGAE